MAVMIYFILSNKTMMEVPMKKKGMNQSSIYDKILGQKDMYYKRGTMPIIGIDIGSNYIKMVKMKRNNKIARFAIEPIPEGVMAQGRIEAQEPLIDLIKNIKSKYKISGDSCAVCISGNEIIVRELTIPEMNEDQIMENIRHEIASFLPFKHEDYTIDYKVIDYQTDGNDGIGKLKVLVAAVPIRQAKAYVDVLKKAKLKVKYIDVGSNVDSKLSRWIIHTIGKNDLKDIAIIDFGAQTTDVTILNKGNYSLHKMISNGGEYLTSIIADKAGMDMQEAEEYKRKINFFEASEDNMIAQHVVNYFDYLIMDINRILEFYKNRNNHKGVDQIYIMGGGSFLKGLSNYFEKRLGVKVFPLSEALEMFRGDLNQTEYLPVLFNAIGATMREEW